MLKRNFAILLLLAFFTLFSATAVFAAGTDEMSDEEALAALAAEPPLTQEDIDTFVKNAPALQAAAEQEDEAAYMKLIEEIGWSEIRAAYIPLKIGIAWAVQEDPESAMIIQALFPPETMPKPEEQALVEKNMDKIAPFFAEEE